MKILMSQKVIFFKKFMKFMLYELFNIFISYCIFILSVSGKKCTFLRYARDFSEENLETPRKRKIFWKTYQQTLKYKNYKIKLL